MYRNLKAVISLVLLLLLAGCNSDGMNLGGDSSSGDSSSGEPVVLSSLFDTDTSSFDSEGGNETSDSGDGAAIAIVHNPEPATMLLWGMGLAGAAWARKRKKA